MSGDELRREYVLRAKLIESLRVLSKQCGDEPALLDAREELENTLIKLTRRNREQRAHLGPWIAGPK